MVGVDRASDADREGFAGVLVDDVEQLQRAAIDGGVEPEVQRPHVVGVLGTEPLGRDGRLAEPEPLPLPLRHAQPLLAPVGGNLRAAEAAREELRTRVRRGERVAPSRQTFEEVATAWLAAQSQLRPRTIEKYEGSLRLHLLPRLGRLRIAEINEDDVVRVVSEMQAAGKAGWTIRGALVPLGRIFGHAARRGLIGSNPLLRLEKSERPEQLGHASPTITLGVYSHLFGQAQHAQRARDALEAAYGTVLEPSGGEGRRNGVPASSAEVVDLQGTGY